MGIFKRKVLKIIAGIFAIFLFLKYALSSLFVIIFGKMPLKVVESLKRANYTICSKINLQQQKDQKSERAYKQEFVKISDCFQSVIDSAISLCLTATLVNYNEALVQGTLYISHHIHHSFWSLINNEIPDYTRNIKDEYSCFLVWAFILLGFFGFSSQIAFVIDLINLLTFPTKIMYRLLRMIYSKCLTLIRILYEFICTNDKKWITCPYNQRLINSNYRTAALCILIVLVQLTIVTVFYYAWLCIIILVLVLVQNSLENLYTFSLKIGKALCLLKRIELNQKYSHIEPQFCPIFQPQTESICLKLSKKQKSIIKNMVWFSIVAELYKHFQRLIKMKLKKFVDSSKPDFLKQQLIRIVAKKNNKKKID